MKATNNNTGTEQFVSIFFRNELKTLFGDKNRVVIILVLLMTFTFISLGFAVGGLENLKDKMDNPFTNWVELEVDPKVQRAIPKIEDLFETDSIKQKYGLDGLGRYQRFYLQFYRNDFEPLRNNFDTLSYLRPGRTIDPEETLLHEILKPEGKNIIYIDTAKVNLKIDRFEQCGIIVTKDFLNLLHYDDYKTLKYLPVLSRGKLVFLPLLGIVRQLPNRCGFIVTNRVFNILESADPKYKKMLKINGRNDEHLRFFSQREDDALVLDRYLTNIFKIKEFNISSEEIQVNESQRYFIHTISILPTMRPDSAVINKFIEDVVTSGKFAAYNYLECSDDADEIIKEEVNYLTFNFNNLQQIRPFQKLMSEELDLEIPMQQVETRENFKLVSRLTLVLGLVLFISGITSILLFLSNHFRNHLTMIKPNLGTFKAFGLSNQYLMNIYTRIIFAFVLVGGGVAFPLSMLLGKIIDAKILEAGFSLINYYILSVLLIIGILVFFYIRFTIARILRDTPGNLIYNR